MNLTIAPAAWSRELAQLLEAAMRRDPWCTLASLERDVAAGRATLLAITREGGELFGAVVLEIQRHDRGADGVIVACAFMQRTGWRIVPELLEDLERRFRGLTRIRVQTPSRGLVKMLHRRGYCARQVVLYKELAPAPAFCTAQTGRIHGAQAAALELPDLDPRAFAGGWTRPLQPSPGRLFIKGHQKHQTTHQTNQQDRRLALGEGAAGISGDSNVLNVLDAGAIGKAFDFATVSDQETHRTLAGALDFAGVVYETGAKQIEKAYSEARGDATQKNLLAGAAIATVAVVAVTAWGKK